MIQIELTSTEAEALHASLEHAEYEPGFNVIVLGNGAVAFVLRDNTVIPLSSDLLDNLYRRSLSMRSPRRRSFFSRLKALVGRC